MRTYAPTRAYVARRRAEGRTTKEIMRYITRQLFRTLASGRIRFPQPLDVTSPNQRVRANRWLVLRGAHHSHHGISNSAAYQHLSSLESVQR